MDKLTKIYLLFNAVLLTITLAFFIRVDFYHKTVDNVGYDKLKKSVNSNYSNRNDVYYVKLYKESIGEGRFKFESLKIEETLEKKFKYINNCRFTRYSIISDGGKIINLKVRNQNIYQYVYTKIPKNGLEVLVSDYILMVDIIDKDKLAHLLTINKRLSLKPISIRIWLNIRNDEINGELLNNTNKDLEEVGLKITEYTKL